MKRTALTLLPLALCAIAFAQESDFTMTILHTNDMHGHVLPSTVKGKSVGGYARQASVIIDRRSKAINPILLNAGDVFQGTLFFNEYEGLADLSFMNIIGYDAMCVGNHEFDRGIQPLVNFANLARFPLIATNLDTKNQPELARVIKKSTILNVGGEKVGIVGAVPNDLLNLILPIPGMAVLDYVKSIQSEVDNLTKQGINKIVLVSHAGLGQDRSTAPKFRNIDVIVGGHSHTLLGHVNIPDYEGSGGEYPVVTKSATNENMVIVQAWEWSKVVGEIELNFDPKGVLKSWQGAPILVDDSWPENPFVKTMVEAFSKPINALMTKPVGETKTDLNRGFSGSAEPTMGYVIADAALAKTKGLGSQLCFWNAGGVRSAIPAGKVTYGQLAEVCPFGNQLVVLDLTGAEILSAVQHGIGNGGMLYPSKGFEYTITKDNKFVTASLNGFSIVPTQTYKVTFSNFTSGGGDGHETLKNAKGKRIDTGFVDLEALIEHFEKNNPITMNDSRIKTR